ncbi:hypothetical protein EXIGLDRAFT_697317 [Exidia glandulosa HHB12029]|uniref:Uncharacterized protein n=1 Tax=Exidia glandulosa HHB12029 TaxID=1314781 RepID=A0A165EU55_EXIGL|nr:hypothetical protein EXIGLDRAFT_697317 [Exidia glandulosa HHB12029]
MSSIVDTPAPWNLDGEMYWIMLGSQSALPHASYHALEQPDTSEPHDGTHTYLGGQGMVWIVRYQNGNIGPYDELIYFPGDFAAPSGHRRARVTLLYVSTKESVYNGRRNWNVPKHLANFAFTPQEDGSTLIAVTLPSASQPFFAAVCQPTRFFPSRGVPFNAAWIPSNLPLVQPPLRAGPTDKPEEVGTDEWKSTAFDLRGRVRPVWWSAHLGFGLEQYANGVEFPKLTSTWSLGVHWPTFDMIFNEPGKVDCEPPA